MKQPKHKNNSFKDMMILYIYFIFYQVVQCLAPLSFLIDSCIEFKPMAHRSDGFRALGVKKKKNTPTCLLTQVKKKISYEAKLSVIINQSKLYTF
jgi:hypothetical protein